MEISNNKSQITNKLQHAAQAPALRVTKIPNSKPSILEEWQKNSKKYFNPYWNNRNSLDHLSRASPSAVSSSALSSLPKGSGPNGRSNDWYLEFEICLEFDA
ncbi:MAG: hypothetical protein V3S16_09620 [Candidatus Desulfatibia sp.]|uniref:hypothetical protein n=1 Tax=Candidatus Desulfatibia sp. TaxID=3101189 RepID=UPI002F2EEEC8